MSAESFTSPHPEPASPPPSRLWFGLVASVAAWLLLGAIDLLVLWNECAHQQQYGGEGSHSVSRILSFAISIAFLLVAVAGGATSYYNWRGLSRQQNLLETNATDRREFMALLGVIISVTLGMGIVWLSIPPLLIQLCERAK
jgi:high-affinity Fe2+/Pb2+ permease